MDSATAHSEEANVEVADIFRAHGEEYRRAHGMSGKQRAVMRAIENCRTAACGSHLDQCDNCGFTDYNYNSCRDRHCPKCQGSARHKWVSRRIEEVLPVAHYHAVFSLPHLLHDIVAHNRRLIYNLLFQSAAQTLLAFGRDPKWLGGEIGFYGVLHTWGQTLWQHPHLHFIVAGGALTREGRWVEPRYPAKFLFPIKALSKVFRGKFVEALKAVQANGKLVIPPSQASLAEDEAFERFINRLVGRDWVAYCKPPFGDAAEVVRYIGRYTHRVAISNRRIASYEAGAVTFHYKNYRKNRINWQWMQLDAGEFIRRFMWHVLPPGYHKIRHYGFLANGRRRAKTALIRTQLAAQGVSQDAKVSEESAPPNCPSCGDGRLRPLWVMDRLGQIVLKTYSPRMESLAWNSS
jgi:hypothetical protein